MVFLNLVFWILIDKDPRRRSLTRASTKIIVKSNFFTTIVYSYNIVQCRIMNTDRIVVVLEHIKRIAKECKSGQKKFYQDIAANNTSTI
jgi:hypothetical protein